MVNPWFAHEHDLQLVDTVGIYIFVCDLIDDLVYVYTVHAYTYIYIHNK